MPPKPLKTPSHKPASSALRRPSLPHLPPTHNTILDLTGKLKAINERAELAFTALKRELEVLYNMQEVARLLGKKKVMWEIKGEGEDIWSGANGSH
jgi:hypothetical protein